MLKHIVKSSNFVYFNNTLKFILNTTCKRNKKAFLKQLSTNHNLTFSHVPRTFCTSAQKHAKHFVESENIYAYNVIRNNIVHKFDTGEYSAKISSLNEFNLLLDVQYRDTNASQVLAAFKAAKDYCIDNNINISDSRFDNLVDGLMDHCQNLTDQELHDLIECITEYPPTELYNSHNFHDVWSCLDDMCVARIYTWKVPELYAFCYLWYKLGLARKSDFVFNAIDKCAKWGEKMTKDELVHMFFFLNVCRRKKVSFEYEYALETQIKKMMLDEMAIVCLGYFKTKSVIKIASVMEYMLKKLAEDSHNANEITITAILKAIRLSQPGKLGREIHHVLDKLCLEIDRLSNLACLHMALIGTGVQLLHEESLKRVSQKIVEEITVVEKVRLKDIERILHALSMFDFNPNTTPDIYQASLDELTKNERLTEIIKYPRCLPCALNYLSIKNIYSYELMDRILDIEFINETYGKGAKLLPRELFILDNSIEIECPNYTGNRLSTVLKYKAAKWLTDFTPIRNQKYKTSATDKLFLDVFDSIEEILGDKKLFFVDHVLPHFSRADVILCKDTKTNKFIEAKGFENYVLGDVQVPFNDGTLKWYAVVILGWNNTIRDTSLPVGYIIMKKRQLEKIGYHPVYVVWNEYMKLSPEEKIKYISNKIM